MLNHIAIARYCELHGLEFWDEDKIVASGVDACEWEGVLCAGIYPATVGEMSGPLCAIALYDTGDCSVISSWNGLCGDELSDVSEDAVRSGCRLHAPWEV